MSNIARNLVSQSQLDQNETAISFVPESGPDPQTGDQALQLHLLTAFIYSTYSLTSVVYSYLPFVFLCFHVFMRGMD